MSLLFLTKDDVQLVKNGDGKEVLRHKIRGYSLVFFYSMKAEACGQYIPIFKNLPNKISGCQIGMFNVASDSQSIQLCKRMFDYVPFIALYFDGVPFLEYTGPPDEKTICDFIIQVAQSKQNKQKFGGKGAPAGGAQAGGNAPAGGAPPAGGAQQQKHFGIPLCGKDDIKYLVFDTAYVTRK